MLESVEHVRMKLFMILTACAVTLQDTSFWMKCWKLMVPLLLCIGRLVSKTDNVMHLIHMCRLVVLIKRFIYDATDSGYMGVPPRCCVTPVGRLAKRQSFLEWQRGLWWSCSWGFTSQGRVIIFGSQGTWIIFSGVCNHLCSYTPRYQFLAEMLEAKGVMPSLHWQTGL